MSRLQVFEDGADAAMTLETRDPGEIAATLARIGVRFEQWPTRDLPPGADSDAILRAYAPEIERLKAEGGYQSMDIVSIAPDHPERAAMRTKFLSEHTHEEDEVRFFVDGAGLFTLHHDGRVYAILCERGDLIGVPARTRHWFDMGPSPRFTAIRLFINPDGWVARFTGDGIAERYPRLEPATS